MKIFLSLVSIFSLLIFSIFFNASFAKSEVLKTNTASLKTNAEEGDILEKLHAISGMSEITEVDSGVPDGYRFFIMRYEQPVDHEDPHGPQFKQNMTLLHRSVDAPMVYNTKGYYNSSRPYRGELAQLLNANKLSVEHRYFKTSTPDLVDWSLLTIKQAATDHHRIVEAIRPLYTGKWVSTGASKGGMTSLYHRHFFPNDVDGTVAYVAPLSFGKADLRSLHFLANVSTEECRESMKAFQREALTRRTEMTALIGNYVEQNDLHISRMSGGLDQALDLAVGETYFQFFQYGTPEDCATIPPVDATDQELFDFLKGIFWLYFIADEGIELFEAYFYQAVTQLGYPALNTAHIEDLLQYNPNDYTPYIPAISYGGFDYGAMFEVALSLYFTGKKIMYIYGESDPWSFGPFWANPSPRRQQHKFIAPLGNHGASINGLAGVDQLKAFELLEEWTDVSPSVSPDKQNFFMSPEPPSDETLSRFRL